jgi:hypothetical protein
MHVEIMRNSMRTCAQYGIVAVHITLFFQCMTKILFDKENSKDKNWRRCFRVTSGVPQESHIGPLCFIWFFNRISVIFNYVCVRFYTDDMKLFFPVRDFQGCIEFQSDLNILSEWCEENSLFLNVD